MSEDLIIRNFNDAIFVFNPKNRKSLFVEGTISDIVTVFLKHPNKQIDESYLRDIPSPYKVKAKEDIELVRKSICDFLHGSNDEKGLSLENTLSDEIIETPLQKLLAYAIKKWQIINASIELNYNCNLQCQCCYVGNFNKSGLQRHELQTIAKQLKKAGAVFILFTGGEILLQKDIFEIMNDFSHLGFILEAKSNGMLLTQSAVDKFAKLNLLNLQISIYDIEERYSVFTGRNYKFNHLVKNVQLAVKQGIPVSLSVLVGKHNVNDLDKYHDVLQRTGVVEIFYSPYITPQRNGAGKEKRFRLSRKEMDEKFYPFLEKIGGFTAPKKYRNRCKNGPSCYAGREQIAIDPDGTVFPCLDLRLPIGNLLQSDLDFILKKRKKLLRHYTLEKISKCWQCNIVEYCDSCIGTSLLESGNFTEPSQHKCDITHFYHNVNLKRKEVKNENE